MRPIFRERGKIHAEVQGRLTESLGAVRTVKGYHAEGREQGVFAAGVKRLLDKRARTLTAQSVHAALSSLLLGLVGAIIMYVGARHILAATLTLGGYFTYTMFLGFLIAPIFQIVSIGTQLTESLAGLERTREVRPSRPRTRPAAVGGARHAPWATWRSSTWTSLRDGQARAPKDVSFVSPAGTCHRARGVERLGEEHDHRAHRRVPFPGGGRDHGGRRGPRDGADSTPSAPSSASSSRTRSCSRARSARTSAFSRPSASRRRSPKLVVSRRVDEFADRFPRSSTPSSASAA
jgi:hypothetical protein